MLGRLLECLHIVPAFVPIDTTGAGADGDWVNVKSWRRIVTLIQQGAWAGGTPAVTFEQATDATGAGAKTLGYSERWNGVALTTDIPTRVAVTSNTSNLAAVANSFVMVEHSEQDLDFDNGFVWMRVRVATPGSNADLISATYILGDGHWLAKASTLPTAIA